MLPKSSRRVPAALEIIPFALPESDLTWIDCPDCRRPLDLHQPDEQMSDRLVGICRGCREWFLALLDPGGSEVVMVRLPEVEWLRAASRSRVTPGEPDGLGP